MTRNQHYAHVKDWFDNATGTDIRRIDSAYGHLLYATYLLEVINAPFGSRILEIGCGDGVVMKKMSELRPDLEFCGVDISQTMVSKSMLANPTSIIVAANAADSIPINGTFDIIFSFSVVQYLQEKDIVNCCMECSRLLRRGGRIFHLAIPNRNQRLPKLINDYLLNGRSEIGAVVSSAYDTITRRGNLYYRDGSAWHSAHLIVKELSGRLSTSYQVKVQPSTISWFRFDLIVSAVAC